MKSPKIPAVVWVIVVAVLSFLIGLLVSTRPPETVSSWVTRRPGNRRVQ